MREPTKEEMIEGIAKGFCEFLKTCQYNGYSPLKEEQLRQTIKEGVKRAMQSHLS